MRRPLKAGFRAGTQGSARDAIRSAKCRDGRGVSGIKKAMTSFPGLSTSPFFMGRIRAIRVREYLIYVSHAVHCFQ